MFTSLTGTKRFKQGYKKEDGISSKRIVAKKQQRLKKVIREASKKVRILIDLAIHEERNFQIRKPDVI